MDTRRAACLKRHRIKSGKLFVNMQLEKYQCNPETLDIGKQVKPPIAFKLVFTNSKCHPRELRRRLPMRSEALAIRPIKPELGKQNTSCSN